MFCQNCGNQIEDSAKFCPSCGTPTGKATATGSQPTATTERKQEFVGTIKKCPSCGTTLQSLDIVCPGCGHEFQGKRENSALTKLSQTLTQIEQGRGQSQSLQASGNVLVDLMNVSTKGYSADPTDTQLATVITNFPIPTTKEDIIEFLTMASTSIDYSAYTKLGKNGNPEDRGKVLVANAWVSKIKQAYQKANLTLANDPSFATIQQIYNQSMAEVAAHKKKFLTKIGIIVAIFGGFFAILFILGLLTSQ